MAPKLEISIPSTSIAHSDSKQYTAYTISLRLPLRSYTIHKRYSDFLTLHTSLSETVGSPPPASLPGKSWFKSTVSSPELTEQRRKALEAYLQTINTHEGGRWRNTPVWRAFLNLPSTFSGSSTSTLHSVLTGPSKDAPITDPTVWLDNHRDLKQHLHNARLQLTTRDQASTPQAQHEASANAKSALVKASSLMTALDDGLSHMQKSPSSNSLGAGEIRRRKDLLSAARKDRDALENLLNAMSQKSRLDSAVANIQDHDTLLNSSSNPSQPPSSRSSSKPGRGRVLGKETAETRELDNAGLLQLQQQRMRDQDLDVDELRKIVQRQRELGVAINQELEIQNEMLRMVGEDVDRVQGKIAVAQRRAGKIS